jgi:hypothetical protein
VPQQSLSELEAEARFATDRVALYRQRLYAGRGDDRRLAELERMADGATDRLRRRRADLEAGIPEALAEALRDVMARLDAPELERAERNRLLVRQAELGDLRDELVRRRGRAEATRGRDER